MTNNNPPAWIASILLLAILMPVASANEDKKNYPFARMVRHKDGSRTVTSYYQGMEKQEVKTIDAEGQTRLTRINYLDKFGRPTTFEYYNGTGALILKGVFDYDGKNRMSKETLYTTSGDIVRILTQQYGYDGEPTNPQVKEFQALPADITRWMDPDGEMSQASSSGGSRKPKPSDTQSEKKESKFWSKLNPFNRKKD